ncbi:hypothetical protein WJX77_009496 [Trebouxia sp. C0004]
MKKKNPGLQGRQREADTALHLIQLGQMTGRDSRFEEAFHKGPSDAWREEYKRDMAQLDTNLRALINRPSVISTTTLQELGALANKKPKNGCDLGASLQVIGLLGFGATSHVYEALEGGQQVVAKAAHCKHVINRDVRPNNLMHNQAQIYLVDWGSATLQQNAPYEGDCLLALLE